MMSLKVLIEWVLIEKIYKLSISILFYKLFFQTYLSKYLA